MPLDFAKGSRNNTVEIYAVQGPDLPILQEPKTLTNISQQPSDPLSP